MSSKITKDELEELLIVGAKIRIGKEYSKHSSMQEGDVIVLVDGEFECENGLYTYTENCPAIYDNDRKDYDSIYHLFGNDLEDFMDCEVLTPPYLGGREVAGDN